MRNACLVLLLVASTAHAQSITTGAIQGVVNDVETGLPLGGVTVSVGDQLAITETNGGFKITGLLPGTYDVTFAFADTTLVHGGVVIGVDNVTTLYQTFKIGESIHVDGTPPPINLVSTAHEKRIDRKQLMYIPQTSPSFTGALGSIGGSSNDGVGTAFSGSTSLENRYIVDGIDITGLTFGDVGTPVLSEFIEEMQVVTGGYNAEYGRATGGIVNIVTRTGTDKLRGSIFGVLTPGFLAAKVHAAPSNATSIDITSDRAYSGDFGFELGGPIIPKRAWFYIGVAPQASRTDFTRVTKRQTDCRVVQADGKLSSCDKANADADPDVDPNTGFYITDKLDHEVRSATSHSTSILAKVNVNPTPNDQAQLSLIAMPSRGDSPGLYGLPTSGSHTTGLTTDTAARWTKKLADDATELEALVAWHRSTLDSGSLDPSLDSQPLQVLIGGDLGTFSKLGGESAATAAGCSDGGADDPYPFITNCPSLQYAIGGPGSLTHDKEERRTARLSVTQRGALAGTHEVKAGLDIEDDLKSKARLYSGGAYLENYVGSSVIVHRWAELAGIGETDPRFNSTCTTPDPNGTTTGGSGGTKSFQCSFLGGTLGAPGTQIGGETVSWAAYLRDSWQPLKYLTLNAGVRYEEQRLRYASNVRGTVDPLTGDHIGDTAMTLKGNFAPRLGAVWDPTHVGQAKIFAHWGRFYEAIPMDINDRSFGGEVSDTQTFKAASCGPTDPRLGGPDGNSCLTTGAKPETETLIGSSGVLVAPGIKAEYLDEVLAGAELAVMKNVVVGLTVQHRRLGRAIEDVSTDGANTYIIANPGEWSQAEEQKLQHRIATTDDKLEKARLSKELSLYKGIRIFDKPVRDYDAVELSVSRKFTSGLYLSGSYTYSRTAGNYPGSVSYDNGQIDPNISSQYDLIELLANRRGLLPQDRPHSLKVDAYRGFDLGKTGTLTFGTRIRAISGVPENALGGHYLYGPNESFLLPRGQLGRTELEHGIDVHVSYRQKLSHGTGAELFFDIFNLYNRQGTFNVDETYAPQYSQAAGGAGGTQQNVNPISGGTYEDLIWAKAIDKTGAESATPIGRNPNFHNTTARYAPMSAQLGFRLTF